MLNTLHLSSQPSLQDHQDHACKLILLWSSLTMAVAVGPDAPRCSHPMWERLKCLH